LADVKNREPNPQNERNDRYSDGGGASRTGGAPRTGGSAPTHQSRPPQQSADRGDRGGDRGGGGGASSAAAQGRKRVPPSETNAEIFYYKKQMDAHTQMVIVLNDGEEIIGTIEWYDRAALKINRRDEPNILLLKHNIKYMFKAEDRDGGGGSGGDSSDDGGGDDDGDDGGAATKDS
jgi:sRNA-binding regulator protein Hfq